MVSRLRNASDSVKSIHDQLLAKLCAGEDMRDDLVMRTKDKVECGDYENDLKFDVAVVRVLDVIDPIEHAQPPSGSPLQMRIAA
jgi:hypothetical protein